MKAGVSPSQWNQVAPETTSSTTPSVQVRNPYLKLSATEYWLVENRITLGLPLIGSVAAGSPILAVENVQARYALDASLFKPRADFLLRVRGLSMINAGIFDGDLLAVHRSSEARNGQIVVARLEEDVTVKRYRRHGNVVELIAENPDYAPIVVDTRRQALEIEGIAVGLIRGGEAM